MDNIINTTIAGAVAAGLYFVCEVPLETSLQVGFLALIAYTLTDISRHLRKSLH